MRRRRYPPGVEVMRDRHGKLRVYFRKLRGGPVVALPMIGSPAFAAAYHEALTGSALPDDTATSRPAAHGTIEALIRDYKTSAEYRAVRATTRAGYDLQLETLRREHGHRTLSGMSKENIENKLLAPLADKPGAALSRLKMTRILINHALGKNWLQHDPSRGIKKPKQNKIRSWTDAEIAQFEARWPVGTMQRLAFALLIYTGQRRGDVFRMTWRDVIDDKIHVTQQKTGTKLEIELHEDLRPILAATVRSEVGRILSAPRGKPFATARYFGNWFSAAIDKAGLPTTCVPHGLRKTAGRLLAQAGCSAHEIMSILGHKDIREAQRYCEEANQMQLAASGMARLAAHKRNRFVQTGG
jgi:integrase